jgi:dienelactone hydrolase
VAGLKRDVPIAIRWPRGKPGPLPVVIWVHGGGEGHSNPMTSMEEWSTVTAEAGYLSIAGAHELREGKSRDQLCMALGISPAGCPEFQPLDWDRPKDVSAIIDELVKPNAQSPWRGQIDVNRIAVGGHSAGSAATLTLAGARRLLVDQSVPWNLTDPRPMVFLGFSPQGPGHIGFFETDYQQPRTSWDAVTRPVLLGTGDGDAHCEGPGRDRCKETPMLRRIAFDRMRPGDKYLMYINDSDTFHNIFALKTGVCAEKNVSQAACTAFASWLKSSALAFLDFYVEGRLTAQTWLQNPYLRIASSGVTELERR